MGELKIGSIALGMYQTNCYFVFDSESMNAIVFDPADSGDYIFDFLKEKGISVSAIVLTHGHFDHIYGVKELKAKTGVMVYAHEDEADVLSSVKLNCSASVGRAETIEPDVLIKDGDCIFEGGMSFKVIHTPGHTHGSACYYFEKAKILVAGDTLFSCSVGRTDLPTGSMSTLVRSIKDKLMILPDDVKVYPGHGDSTTIGYERMNNPFID